MKYCHTDAAKWKEKKSKNVKKVKNVKNVNNYKINVNNYCLLNKQKHMATP